ncbi:hypothetical protein [Marinomonas spartinae]|uniref:hypothetical protein n=1 Tax=Marinomonas spartinae TaxID=1792290 RepID=UPI0018F22CFC|nr:hypothetical protein [Marinomonas spartinae]MBJ7555536.1 hypothetical protein [Marinomonas spartinae]
MSNYLDIDLAWGGYYACASKESDEISIIRLLDFNREAYHACLFDESFDKTPGPEVVDELSAFVGYAPIDARGLLNYGSVVLIGSRLLTRDDLEGYLYYLEEFGVPEDEREELVESLIAFSKDKPLALRLSLSDGELQIEERT